MTWAANAQKPDKAIATYTEARSLADSRPE